MKRRNGATAWYFYPRPPRGGRPHLPTLDCHLLQISIHALREEGDLSTNPASSPHTNFYPRPPRGGRPSHVSPLLVTYIISIHALREEGDNNLNGAVRDVVELLSTPSARRATLACRCTSTAGRYFYPRPPRGGRRQPVPSDSRFHRISIHALREEGDALIASLLPQ